MWAVVLFFRRELHRVEVWAPNDGVGDGCWVILRMVAVATGREERKTVQRGWICCRGCTMAAAGRRIVPFGTDLVSVRVSGDGIR